MIRHQKFNLTKEQKDKLSIGIININLEVAKHNFSDSSQMKSVFRSAQYFEIQLDRDYCNIARDVINYYHKNIFLLKNDVTSDRLRKFLKSRRSAIITGAAILIIDIDYRNYNNQMLELGNEQSLLHLANKNSTGIDLKASDKYVLRYGYSDDLEIGRRPWYLWLSKRKDNF